MSAKKRKSKSIQAAGPIIHKQARKPKLTYSDKLINEIREMIETSRARVAQTVNVDIAAKRRKNHKNRISGFELILALR